MPAWSYTALTSYETCPKRHYETRVAKRIVEPESEQLQWGNRVHKAIEARIKTGAPLPAGMEQWEALIAKLVAVKGWTLAESQYALTAERATASWFGKNVWLRCVIDFGKMTDRSILALDWKTGKPKPDADQLMLFAGVMMAVYPAIEKVVTGYVWLKDQQITKETFHRDDVETIWNAFLPRVARLDEAHATNNWPARPSGLCRAWCPVVSCEHNGQRV
ncbi:MAG: hypothetical protein EOM24_10465 [Chloroflexia bacterium]|nr:hypothetical protein [Chloroflexia bacterium]